MGTPVATAKEYYETFARTNCVDLASVSELYDLLNSSAYPYIPVGSHNGYMYRLDPRLGILEANAEEWSDDGELPPGKDVTEVA